MKRFFASGELRLTAPLSVLPQSHCCAWWPAPKNASGRTRRKVEDFHWRRGWDLPPRFRADYYFKKHDPRITQPPPKMTRQGVEIFNTCFFQFNRVRIHDRKDPLLIHRSLTDTREDIANGFPPQDIHFDFGWRPAILMYMEWLAYSIKQYNPLIAQTLGVISLQYWIAGIIIDEGLLHDRTKYCPGLAVACVQRHRPHPPVEHVPKFSGTLENRAKFSLNKRRRAQIQPGRILFLKHQSSIHLFMCLIYQVGDNNKEFSCGATASLVRAGAQSLVVATKELWAAGGIRSLYAGNGLNVVKVMPESAVKFGAFESPRNPPMSKLMALWPEDHWDWKVDGPSILALPFSGFMVDAWACSHCVWKSMIISGFGEMVSQLLCTHCCSYTKSKVVDEYDLSPIEQQALHRGVSFTGFSDQKRPGLLAIAMSTL
ncbi:hypothetical protein HDK77DRAFT_487300 [Phyllosticta capitalensis]